MEIDRITNALQGYLDDYRKLPEILNMLKFCGIEISDREFADYVEAYRQQDNEFYLESCSNGYRFTRDKKAINKSILQRFNKGISMIKHCKRDWQKLSEKDQIAILEQFNSVDIVRVMESVN